MLGGKTDQGGYGREGFIVASDQPYNAFRFLQAYLRLPWAPDAKIFARPRTMLAFIKKLAPAYGLDSKKYATHSLRRGAAHSTTLAGVPDCAIKVMGAWTSDCYTTYRDLTAREVMAIRMKQGCV
jgi:hypothetical protein